MGVQVGQTFVWGKHRTTARALLAAADRLGLPHEVVRTDGGGFVVPDEVADEAGDDLLDGTPAPPAVEPEAVF